MKVVIRHRTHTHTHTLTAVTLVPAEPGLALAAEGAPVSEAGCPGPTGGPGCRHTHPVRQPAPWGAVHTLTWGRQVVHLRTGEENTQDIYYGI